MKKVVYDVTDLVKAKPYLKVSGRNIHYDLANSIKSIYKSFIKTISDDIPEGMTEVLRSDENGTGFDIVVVNGKVAFMTLENYTPNNWIIGNVPIPKKIVIEAKEKESVSYIRSLLENHIEEKL